MSDTIRTTDALLTLEGLSTTTTQGTHNRELIQAIRDLIVSLEDRLTTIEGQL